MSGEIQFAETELERLREEHNFVAKKNDQKKKAEDN